MYTPVLDARGYLFGKTLVPMKLGKNSAVLGKNSPILSQKLTFLNWDFFSAIWECFSSIGNFFSQLGNNLVLETGPSFVQRKGPIIAQTY